MAVYYFRNAGVNWGDAANWSLTDGGGATGAVPTATDDALFTANSGNCTVNASARVCKTLDFTGYTNTITMTFGITVSGNVTLEAAMTIAGASGLTINATATITSNGKIWPNNLTLLGTSTTTTIGDNLTINGLLSLSGVTSQIVNGNTIYCNGGLSNGLNVNTTGTTTIELAGGTVSQAGNGFLTLNTNINGNITISQFYYATNTLTYLSGIVTFSSSAASILSGCTLNTSGMSWNNINLQNTVTLTSNLNVNGILNINFAATINGTFNINANNGITLAANISQGTGVTTLILLGGTWIGAGVLNINTNIFGNITLSGTVYFQGKILTYLSGNVNAKSATLYLYLQNCTLINLDKAIIKNITIGQGITVTMNRFFSGSALIPIRIQSSTTANYTIAFQDGFEKITKFTKISNCTVTNRGQLLCITDKSNKGGNVGVRYINQMPNRVPLNSPTTANPLGYATSTYLLSDPNTILI